MARGVVHFEIPADDEERAGKFYRSAFGWEVNPTPGLSYTMIKTTPTDESGMPAVPGSINGGIFRREGTLTSPVVTVDVEDIDAALEQINALGGSTVMPRQDVGGMGWSAYFKDTEGNIVGLWQNAAPAGGAADAAGTGAAAGVNDIGA
jgi:predicted enzyme related to lactoylglutathione lyase